MTTNSPLETQYREHMERFSHETAAMSFVVVRHPDFKALVEMGKPIIPLLIQDLREKGGESDYIGKFSIWAAYYLLALLVGDEERPEIEEKNRGRLEPIRQMWLRWADKRGI